MSGYVAKASCVSFLRLTFYDFHCHPERLLALVAPTEAERRVWIPQTLGDQVWVLYAFPTVESRLAWERNLPPEVARFLDERLRAYILAHPTHVPSTSWHVPPDPDRVLAMPEYDHDC